MMSKQLTSKLILPFCWVCVFFRGLFFYEVLIVVLRNSLWKCVERFDHFSKCSNYEVWLVNSKQKKETFLSHWYLNRHDLFENFVFNKCSFYFCFFFRLLWFLFGASCFSFYLKCIFDLIFFFSFSCSYLSLTRTLAWYDLLL